MPALYLDGTHTGWLSVGDITDRLIEAGVEQADGFFLNASDYQETEKLERYAGWVSDCLDGQGYRGTGGPLDPARGMQDPPAGQWFVEQAAELLALAEQPLERPTCEVSVTVRERHGAVQGRLRIHDAGTETISGWDLRFALAGGATVDRVWGAEATQAGSVVTAVAPDRRDDLRPGRSHTVGFIATGDVTAEPLLVLLDGEPCRVV